MLQNPFPSCCTGILRKSHQSQKSYSCAALQMPKLEKNLYPKPRSGHQQASGSRTHKTGTGHEKMCRVSVVFIGRGEQYFNKWRKRQEIRTAEESKGSIKDLDGRKRLDTVTKTYLSCCKIAILIKETYKKKKEKSIYLTSLN